MDLNEQACQSHSKLKLTPTVNESSRGIGLPFLDTETLKPSIGPPSNLLTSCAEDSPAKTLALLGKGQDSAEREAASGLSTSKPSTRSNRNISSSKMLQPFALEDWIKSSGKSLRSGMMRNGIVYPLPPLVPLTDVIGCGLWPTPSASKTTLSGELVNVDGTPWDGRSKPHSQSTGKPVTSALADAVKMRPTPNARDHKDSGPNTNYAALAAKSKLAGVAGGSLNPQWVSWLMGYPVDWCDLPDESLPASRTVSKNSKDSAMP